MELLGEDFVDVLLPVYRVVYGGLIHGISDDNGAIGIPTKRPIHTPKRAIIPQQVPHLQPYLLAINLQYLHGPVAGYGHLLVLVVAVVGESVNELSFSDIAVADD